MRTRSVAIRAALWFALSLTVCAGARAAEIKVLASNGVKTVLEELAPQFEQSTGHKLAFRFAPAADLKGQIEKGEAFDVAILTAALIDFLSLEAEAGVVLTDSGGIQEETTYLGVPCFTLRDNTERPVTIRAGTNTLLGLDPAAIAGIPAALDGRPAKSSEPPPLWDGRAAERIADVLSSA